MGWVNQVPAPVIATGLISRGPVLNLRYMFQHSPATQLSGVHRDMVLLFPSYRIFLLVGAAVSINGQVAPSSGGPDEDQHVITSHQDSLSGTTQVVPLVNRPVSPGTAGLVAFGDSYSAGIGTGVHGKETDCRLGEHAHPVLIYADLAGSQGPNTTAFQFLSCTGSTTGNIVSGGERSQIDSFNASINADFALLSIGGNDLGFFKVMNACIFRFYSFYSGTCETALHEAAEQIEGSAFEQRLEMVVMQILDKVQWEKRPWFVITVTGYARFFNADTDECDNCTLGVWSQGPKLDRVRVRKRMNDLVLAVNDKLRKSIDNVNSRFTVPKVIFVDYDARFDGHRFCEPNVTEPAYNRTETWFFLVGGKDNDPNVTDPTPAPNATIAGAGSDCASARTLSSPSPFVDPDTCLGPAESSGDWGLLAICYMARAQQEDPSLRFARDDIISQNSMWYVPTYYGKTFHPRSLGHEAIKDEIYRVWAELGFVYG